MRKRVTTTIDQDKCSGCGLCLTVCPSQTISLKGGKATITGKESLNCGHCAAICPEGAITVHSLDEAFAFNSFPYTPEYIRPGSPAPGALINLMRSRRSCRNYTEKPVDNVQLLDLIKAGTTAPSGTNSQLWTFTLAQDRESVIKLGTRVADYFAKLNHLAANPLYRFLSKLFQRDSLGNYHRNHSSSVARGLAEWYEKGEDHLFHGATAAIIVNSKLEASCPHDDALLASQNILLTAHAMGLGSCLIGFAVHAINNDKSLQQALDIPHDERAYAVIALGYPKEPYLTLTGRKIPLVRRVVI